MSKFDFDKFIEKNHVIKDRFGAESRTVIFCYSHMNQLYQACEEYYEEQLERLEKQIKYLKERILNDE